MAELRYWVHSGPEGHCHEVWAGLVLATGLWVVLAAVTMTGHSRRALSSGSPPAPKRSKATRRWCELRIRSSLRIRARSRRLNSLSHCASTLSDGVAASPLPGTGAQVHAASDRQPAGPSTRFTSWVTMA